MSTTELLGTLEENANFLQKTKINLSKCPKQRLTRGYIEARLKCVEEYWNNFTTAHKELIKCTTRESRAGMSYFAKEDYFTYEELYLNIQADLRDLSLPTPSSSSLAKSSNENDTSELNTSQLRLPKIELPKFTGRYEEWSTFHDLFISLVHKNTFISDVQKLHYLKSSIGGEAETLLRHIQITESNYPQAWSVLKQRYGNKRLILNTVLKRLFNQRKINIQSASQIKVLLDTTNDCLNNLNNMKVITDTWDPVIIFLVVQKLDQDTHKDWEQYSYKENSEDLPTWSCLQKFLESKFRTLELVTPAAPAPVREKIKERHIMSTVATTSTHTEKTCVKCGDNHTLCHCQQFTNMNAKERSEYVKQNRLCYNCLLPGHSVIKCRVPMNCRICHKRHHSLLHEKREDNVKSKPTESTTAPEVSVNHTIEDSNETTIVAHYNNKPVTTLLATAQVTARSKDGCMITMRALIDQGSQACFISEKAAQLLNLKRKTARGSVIGVGSMRTDIKQVVQLQVLSRREDKCLNIQAYVMCKQLTAKIPQNTVAVYNNMQHLVGLDLADPSYYKPGSVDLLLGVKEYAEIIHQELIKGPPGTPCAQRTSLGWILFGEIQNTNEHNSFLVMHHQVEMDDMLKTLWEIDTENKRKYTQEELLCEDIYKRTHTRNEEGRYIVTLPFKTKKPKSPEGNTRAIAMHRLLQLERRFIRKPELKKEYEKVLEEYKRLNHMEEIPAEEIYTKPAVYLPHHAVVKDEKETRKTRVVYDASCKGSTGISLNEELLVGPLIQDDLRSIIMRWRMHAICFVADIEKMYRMVLLRKEDTDFQRILWRSNPSEDVKDYRLLTVTFGTAPAPYLACRTLFQLAIDEGKDHPIAAKMIEDFYVDDVLSGKDTVEEAIIASRQLKGLMNKGGFQLKKWSSNNVEFLKSLPPDEISLNAHLDLNIDGKVKTLGILWNLKTDQLEYKLTLKPVEGDVTKRSILSDVQKLYDPLGWLAPSIITAKLLLQKLWLEQVNWDDKISDKLANEWLQIRSDLENINEIGVGRWINTIDGDKRDVQLHGFSDASSRAYAAVVYARVKCSSGVIYTHVIAARTRVAPLRTISVPRLELCGALLLSQLLRHVSQAMKIPNVHIFAWSDSSIVLAWLAGEPNKWKTFVANRVVEILQNVSSDQWYHVLSEDNPADIASRGLSVKELKNCNLWWKGPSWLCSEEISLNRQENIQTQEEIKTHKEVMTHLNINYPDKDNTEIITQFKDFNDIKQLLTSVSYCQRFLKFRKYINKEEAKHITAKELEEALYKCVIIAQRSDFEEEVLAMKKGKEVKKTSNLKSLNPYLDENGVIRVGGRLRHADIEHESKHPIILKDNNVLTGLIVKNAHKETLHGGVQLMMAYLRSKYWIIRAKRAVKGCIHKCLVCARLRAISKTQLMGDLPKVRVTPARPFLHSGVDFAGPFQVLISKGRGAKTNKAYIAIFICMAIKAIHLELVGNLSGEAFIDAFKRFTSRRGKCAHLWSDQGRNFIGANKELKKAWQDAQLDLPDDVANLLAKDGTEWHFIPAYSPNFGGLWEAGVKSFKHHLKRVLTTNLTFEEMSTLLCQIEACLNSRPLSPVEDSDMDATEVLTPGHFLIGEPPIVVPHPSLENIKITHLSRWQHTQKLLGDFWKRWQLEYLSRLQQRPKWMKRESELEKGQIVLIKTDNLPPGKWNLGRIVEKHPGPDGLTRVYSVKSGDSIVKRCITKLCYLPLDYDDDE